jgi:hypothetical protein
LGEITHHRPVLLIVAMVSRYDDALRWSIDQLSQTHGPAALQSSVFDFVETEYYHQTMGDALKKQFVAFETLVPPQAIVAAKIHSNELENQYANQHNHAQQRPLNLDPGYISEAKLVLATTKDRDHRLYMSDGIYAEVTLHYRSKTWCSSRWTYPDYQRDDFQDFFTRCRLYLRDRYRQSRSPQPPQ